MQSSGTLRIIEIRSRFLQMNHFQRLVERIGFENVSRKIPDEYFVDFEFKKKPGVTRKVSSTIPDMMAIVKPCIYKRR